jgi:hypothetical protein
MGRSDKSPISGKEIEKGHVESTTADKETHFEGKNYGTPSTETLPL